MVRLPLAIVAAALVLAGCEDRPDAATLAAWRKEAQEANARRVAEEGTKDAGPPWTLHLQGQVERPAALSLVDVRGTGPYVEIVVPQNKFDAPRTYRGVKIGDIVDHAKPRPEAKVVTFVGSDGYWSTVELQHLRAYDALMAFELDGKLLTPANGGPIGLHLDLARMTPELQRRYQNAGCMYVTHMIIGDEAAHLRVGDKTLDAAALDALPETKLAVEKVEWRTGWLPTPQTLWGPRLRDVVGRSTLPARVRVYGKDPLHQKADAVAAIGAADLASCDLVLARRYGADRKPIPSSMGGPVLLAVGNNCRDRFPRERGGWTSFVESVEVTP